jgi:hypothetical protein
LRVVAAAEVGMTPEPFQLRQPYISPALLVQEEITHFGQLVTPADPAAAVAV